MRYFRSLAVILISVTALAQAVSAADLTGKWVATVPGFNGQTTEVSYFLKSESPTTFTGYVTQGNNSFPISGGTVNGNQLTFTVTRTVGGADTKVRYAATLNKDTLTIQVTPVGGRGGFGGGRGAQFGFGIPQAQPQNTPPQPTTQIARRVSTDQPPPLPVKANVPPPATPVPYNGLAKTPPMGWNSWNKFARQVNDQVVRQIADAMVASGMKDAGYVYVNIDDTWEGTRDAQGNIRSNEKFPDMKALADYVHSKGLKLGIYSSPGPKTCAGFEGSYQHEEQDAKTFARWGIDYIKYDWCSASQVYEATSMPGVYAKMGEALLHSGRQIVYSLCQYGLQDVGEWGAKAGGNLWRTTGDIQDNWNSMSSIGFDQQIGREKYAGPGHWNDPDMLEIGNGGMNDTEYRTHMSLWSLLAAPLLAGNDLRSMAPDIQEILTNKEVIAIDQDPLGQQATRVAKDGDLEVWMRKLADGSRAVGLFNRGAAPERVVAKWADIGVSGPQTVRDLWVHVDRGSGRDAFWATVPSHGVVLVKMTPGTSAAPQGRGGRGF